VALEGVGPKKAKLFYDRLKIKGIDDLEKGGERREAEKNKGTWREDGTEHSKKHRTFQEK